MVEKEKMNKEQLQKKFDEFNRDKFEGKLPHYDLRFRKMNYFGWCNCTKKYISINPKPSEDMILNTLLHEMIHAELYRRGCKNVSHSIKFWKLFVEEGGNITDINKKIFAKARCVADRMAN